jgi:uncharacterized protein (DUF2147 family)
MKRVVVSMCAGALAALWVTHATAAVESPLGKWKLSSGKVTVQIDTCGPKLCGKIVGLAKPLDRKGKPKVDKNNPDSSMRNRPLIGVTVFNDMQSTGTNSWKGKIYNADDGSIYRATAQLEGDRFTVKACWGPICKKIRFNRVK